MKMSRIFGSQTHASFFLLVFQQFFWPSNDDDGTETIQSQASKEDANSV